MFEIIICSLAFRSKTFQTSVQDLNEEEESDIRVNFLNVSILLSENPIIAGKNICNSLIPQGVSAKSHDIKIPDM